MPLSIAFLLTLIAALVWLRAIDLLAVKGIIDNKLSRKIIHIGTGPIFVLCWLFFPENVWSRYVAAVIPLLITIQFFMVGIGLIEDEASVEAMSRTGNRREILKGPLFYGIVFVILTILFWKESPVGIIALMLLSGGDGFADVVGRRIKSKKISWSPTKSIAGTIAMFSGGFLFSWLIVFIFQQAGIFSFSTIQYTINILILSGIAAFIELLPIKDYDNITVPLITTIIGLFLF